MAQATPPGKPTTLPYTTRPVKVSSGHGPKERTLSPELHGAEGVAERLLLRDKHKDLVRHTRAVDAAQVGLVEPAQQRRVLEVEAFRNAGYGEAGEDQIDADAGVLELDDRYVSVGHRSGFFDSSGRGHLSEDSHKMLEKVLAGDVFWDDNQRVDVGA
jgi:hypothetical protein